MDRVSAVESDFDSMSRFTLRFGDSSREERYRLATESIRIVQMRAGLLLACLLYVSIAVLDIYFIPMQVGETAISVHMINAVFLLICAVALFNTQSYNARTALVIIAVTVSWLEHLYLTLISDANIVLAEGYLMLIWVWLVSGLSLRQGGKVVLSFFIMFEAVVYYYPTLSFPNMMVHQYFLFVAALLGGLGAYLAEFYKKQNFLSLERISEQKEQLVKDAAQLNQLSQALKQSGDAILITNKDAMAEYVNNTFTTLTGYLPEEIIGKSPEELNCMNQDITIQEVMDKVDKEGAWDNLIVAHKKDGTTYPALLSVAPVYDNAGVISHYIYSHKDVTEHQRMENQLRHSQKMDAVGALVGGIAHEFNNNLAGISGNVYLLERELEGNQEAISRLKTVNKLAFTTAEVVKKLLAYACRGLISAQTLDFATLMNQQVTLFRVNLPAKVAFTYEPINQKKLPVDGDTNLLAQMLFHLFTNALDAVDTTPQPEIKVCVEKWVATPDFKQRHPEIEANEFVRISVIDNGCGIDEKVKAQMFEPFYSTKEVDQGSGLGLSMVHGVVQSHNGVVEVTSEVGNGSRFDILLPLHEGEGVTTASSFSIPTQDIALASQRAKILIVDDNKEVLSMLTLLLDKLGYDVLKAGDGEEGLAVYKANHASISLAILDIVMPKMNGIELGKAIRAENAEAKILFLTGYDPEQYLNSKDLAIEETMMKPFKVAALSQRIKEMLEINKV